MLETLARLRDMHWIHAMVWMDGEPTRYFPESFGLHADGDG